MTSFLARKNHAQAEFLRQKFTAAWQRTDELFSIVAPAMMLAQPIVWRHPLIFYVGHLPAFSWNQICGGVLRWPSLNRYFDDLFCRGIDPDVDTGECHWHPDIPEEWPNMADTVAYRDRVRQAIFQSLDVIGDSAADEIVAGGNTVFWMVLEHEAMHQETLLYMLQQLPITEKRRPATLPAYSFRRAADRGAIRVPSGSARLGADFDDVAFGWDNEFTQIRVEVPSFTIDSFPVTNAEYFEFVESGSYDDERYWLPHDWRWKQIEQKRHPTCWQKRDSLWCYRAMFDVFSLEQVAQWPVYVSLAEARAYASWRGKRLPSEGEFHRAAYGGPDGRESHYPWGDADPEPSYGNFDFNSWSPVPVGSRPAGTSRWGVNELVGNGWEWTDTAFGPFPGFAPMPSYPDYSKDFFDGKHFVLKGASWATPAQLVRRSFRNWYQARYPYVFAKFRCVAA